jgi:hypothetical protein
MPQKIARPPQLIDAVVVRRILPGPRLALTGAVCAGGGGAAPGVLLSVKSPARFSSRSR